MAPKKPMPKGQQQKPLTIQALIKEHSHPMLAEAERKLRMLCGP